MIARELEEAAVTYGERWRVLPCRDKVPLIAWKREATGDERQLRQWWERWPWALIGLVVDGGRLVLDVDVSDERDGPATLRELTAELGPLPRGPIASTPSGGHHLYLKTSAKISIGVDVLGPGIDVRAGGNGFVVAPPSRSPRGVYEWIQRGPIPELPAAWARRLTSSSARVDGSPREPSEWADLIETPIPPGAGHGWLLTLCGHWLAHGLDGREVLALAALVNARRERPHDPADLGRIVADLELKQRTKTNGVRHG